MTSRFFLVLTALLAFALMTQMIPKAHAQQSPATSELQAEKQAIRSFRALGTTKLACLSTRNDDKNIIETCGLDDTDVPGFFVYMGDMGLRFFAPWVEAHCHRTVLNIRCEYKGYWQEFAQRRCALCGG
jgi:hypothetical protein